MPAEYRGRGDIRTRIYNSAAWKRTRRVVKARAGGLCESCGGQGTICDHVEPLLVLIEQGRDPFDPNECQWLCHTCSGRKDGVRGSREPREKPHTNRFLKTVVSR